MNSRIWISDLLTIIRIFIFLSLIILVSIFAFNLFFFKEDMLVVLISILFGLFISLLNILVHFAYVYMLVKKKAPVVFNSLLIKGVLIFIGAYICKNSPCLEVKYYAIAILTYPLTSLLSSAIMFYSDKNKNL